MKDDKTSSTGRQLSLDAFRDNLRSMVQSKGILGKDLAFAINTTPATISRYLTDDRDPDLEYVYRLARYFGVTIDYMLGVHDGDPSGFSKEAARIADLYSRASLEDQAVVKTVLRKYEAGL